MLRGVNEWKILKERSIYIYLFAPVPKNSPQAKCGKREKYESEGKVMGKRVCEYSKYRYTCTLSQKGVWNEKLEFTKSLQNPLNPYTECHGQ